MRSNPFDDSTADAVFGGRTEADDLPAGLREAAELARAARQPGSADELTGHDVMAARIAAAVGGCAELEPEDVQKESLVHGRLRKTRLFAAAAAAVLVCGTAAAAATGSLPSPIEGSHGHDVRFASTLGASTTSDQGHHLGWGKGPGVSGKVASVDGDSTAGKCGTSGATTGTFTLTGHDNKTVTVNINGSTTFVDPGVTTPTYGNVCVGGFAGALGTNTNNTVAATKVFIFPKPKPKPHPPEGSDGMHGKVASVDGDSTAGKCGTAGATTGSFTLTDDNTTITVNISGSTVFVDPGVPSPSFANVCVGTSVGAKGTNTNNTVTATKVFVMPKPKHDHEDFGAFGKVASVDGDSTAGKCGTAGETTGMFTLLTHDNVTVTVNIDGSTTFMVPAVQTPSFANVCVGLFAAAKGTNTNNTVAATKVFVAPNFPPKQDHEGFGAFGKVASVNGDSTAGKCGSGSTGSFTLMTPKGTTVTVNVDSSTTILVPAVQNPSLANVCVGLFVAAKGTNTNNTIAATKVFVAPNFPSFGGGDHSGGSHFDHGGSYPGGGGGFPGWGFPGRRDSGHQGGGSGGSGSSN